MSRTKAEHWRQGESGSRLRFDDACVTERNQELSLCRSKARTKCAYDANMAAKFDDSGAGTTTASVTYHLPAERLREAVTTYYLVKVTGPGTVWDQNFPEWPNFRIILSCDWEAHV